MKKSFIIFIAILALVSFGTVSSAHAFVGLTSLTIIIGTGFAAVVAGAEIFKHSKAKPEPAQKSAPAPKVESKNGEAQKTIVLSPD